MSGPTKDQIKAVRAVLYDHAQLKLIAEDIQQINLLMNLAGPPLPSNDVRIAVGTGPRWVIPATGAVDPAVLDAVARCQKLAKRLQAIGDALADLDLPADDKHELTTAMHEQAQTWTARARLWGQAGKPSDPAGALATITAHQTASDAAVKKVTAYLRPVKIDTVKGS